jgi:hypothetical protein
MHPIGPINQSRWAHTQSERARQHYIESAVHIKCDYIYKQKFNNLEEQSLQKTKFSQSKDCFFQKFISLPPIWPP